MFGKKKDLSGYKLYDLCNSQNGMYLMHKFTLHKQQVQIPTSVTVDYDLDFDLLQKAFDIEIGRNESLRIRFTKVKGAVKQYFIEPYTLKVEHKHFSSVEEQQAFFDADAQKPCTFLKDDCFRIYFFSTDGGENGVYSCFSHLVIDAMGIVGFYMDLFRVYRALRRGEELPPALDSYEEYIQNELKKAENTAKMEKHEAFYKDYFLKNGEPYYAAVHGHEYLDAYRKKKKNPDIRVPMAYNPLHDKCDMIVEHIEAEDAKKIFDYCIANQISPESIFVMGLRSHCSGVNYRIDDVSMMSICGKRATVKEKNMSGCMAEPLIFRSKLSEDLTFEEAVKELVRIRTSLYRHLDYPYTKARDLSLKLFNFGPIQGANSLMYSWIPTPIDDSFPFKFHFRTYNLGRYFTPLYTITIPNSKDKGIDVYYMYRTKLSTEAQMRQMHKNFIGTILKGIENPQITVGELLDGISE
ncbi:MAG: hypothetical protein IKV21_04195 [Clostridia bacterium]|nr:hypothetical protein [Clostridia bacterium]